MVDLKISEEDLILINNYKIKKDKNSGYYRIYFDDGHYEYLHRFIMSAKKGEIVDHIDRDRSNNYKENLRIVSKKINNYNRNSNNILGRGIYFDKSGNRYRACISNNNKTLKLGSFKNIIDAKIAYNKKALELYGDVAFQHIF